MMSPLFGFSTMTIALQMDVITIHINQMEVHLKYENHYRTVWVDFNQPKLIHDWRNEYKCQFSWLERFIYKCLRLAVLTD